MSPKNAKIYEAYLAKRDQLLRFFMARARGNGDFAEDIVQEIYLKIADIAPEYIIENPSAYLFQIGNNIFLNKIRSQNREINRDNAWNDANAVTIGNDAIETAPNAEQKLELKGQIQKARAIINALPERDRRIFQLLRIDKLTQKQAAEELGLSKSTIEKSIAQTLRQLMQIMNE